jgi:hypothetical protein
MRRKIFTGYQDRQDLGRTKRLTGMSGWAGFRKNKEI